jgi:hypothetical protein
MSSRTKEMDSPEDDDGESEAEVDDIERGRGGGNPEDNQEDGAQCRDVTKPWYNCETCSAPPFHLLV